MALWLVPFVRDGTGSDVEYFAVVEAADEVAAQRAFEEHDEAELDGDASVTESEIRRLPTTGVIVVGAKLDE